jgi:hypothetical protein
VCTRLAAASDKVYQLLAHGGWFSQGTPASSTTKTGRHDIAEILLKVVLSTKNQSINHIYLVAVQSRCHGCLLPSSFLCTFYDIIESKYLKLDVQQQKSNQYAHGGIEIKRISDLKCDMYMAKYSELRHALYFQSKYM